MTVAPDLSPLDRTIETLVCEGRADGDEGAVVDITPFAITAATGRILERAAAAAPAGRTIEVGCASALSTLYIARGRRAGMSLDDASYDVIDPRQRSHWKNIGRRTIERADLSAIVRMHEAPAHDVLPVLLAAGVRAGFMFIDGWHMLDYVMVEAFYGDLMLSPGGILALHDLWMPGLQHFAAFWCANRGYEPVSVTAVGAPDFVTTSTASEDRACGAEESMLASFRETLLPFVDQSVLLLRKVGEDQRGWQDFSGY